MTYLMLYGSGWTQRWQLDDATARRALDEIVRVGRDETTQLPVLDPGSGEPTVLVVAWRNVVSAVLLGSEHETDAVTTSSGQYR